MFERDFVSTLAQRLEEPRRFIQMVIGPRQTGKSTAVSQALSRFDCPIVEFAFDRPRDRRLRKLEEVWGNARKVAEEQGIVILSLDEVQKIPQWSSGVKALWDEDTRRDRNIKVVVTGSSSLMLQSGLSESLMGRFEVIRSTHWNLWECMQAFDYTLDDFLAFGGYPGAAALTGDPARWFDYLHAAIINPTIEQDILEMENVRKPALMRALFEVGAVYSGQEISYRKILGQLDDQGNTDTIAHYLELLSTAGLLTGLKKYSDKILTSRTSSPRMLVHDTSLMVAASGTQSETLLGEPDKRGHLVESAVGAYLLQRGEKEHFDVFWWRERDAEVDFVIQQGRKRTAIEVKSGRAKSTKGLGEFVREFPGTYSLIVGSDTFPLEDFLLGKISLFQDA